MLKPRRTCSGSSASSRSGRAFTRDEIAPGRHDVVILGHGFWSGGLAATLSRGQAAARHRWFVDDRRRRAPTPARIDGARGVHAARHRPGESRIDRLALVPMLRTAAPGVTVTAARAEMATIAATLSREFRFDEGMGVFVAACTTSS